MRRIGPAIAVVLLVATGCSSQTLRSGSAAGASPDAAAATAPSVAMTEDSTCADYLHLDEKTRYAFIYQEWLSHIPQTAAPQTLSSYFAPSGKPTVINGNETGDSLGANFLVQSLDRECPKQPSTVLSKLLNPAWTSSPAS